jgi:spore coat polysaccharide biosynthesis protein SpsF
MTDSEAIALERLWAGEFGDDYIERNADAWRARGDFWQKLLRGRDVASVLEVGCNAGANLHWVAENVPVDGVFGVDVSRGALERLRGTHPQLNVVVASGRNLPFRDRWFDLVFTMGVLIHVPPVALPVVMAEVVRCSNRYVLCAEYFAEEPTEVDYRGQTGALFKRDFGGLYRELFPDLELIEDGFLGRDDGWDDVTWWLFRRP